MHAKSDRKRLARELFTKLGLSIKETANLLQVSQRSVERYAKEDKEMGKSWIDIREMHQLAAEPQARRFRKCLSLILSHSEEALQELNHKEELTADKRAQAVAGIMETIHKATNTAKKLDPEMSLELILGEVLKIVNQAILEISPELAQEWHKITFTIEERVLSEKEKWQ